VTYVLWTLWGASYVGAWVCGANALWSLHHRDAVTAAVSGAKGFVLLSIATAIGGVAVVRS
jgi:hypothetical protein